MKVTIEKPQIISLLYTQEKTDKDYGSCVWARFYLDLKNYTMTVESDCGNYSYGWIPTPDHESFLHLCTRMNDDYILGKFSSPCVLDHDKTWEKIQELLDEALEISDVDFDDWDKDRIKDACYGHNGAEATARAIESAMKDAGLDEVVSDFSYEIYTAVVEDYPRRAQKIVEVYDKYIRPVIIELEKGERNEANI